MTAILTNDVQERHSLVALYPDLLTFAHFCGIIESRDWACIGQLTVYETGGSIFMGVVYAILTCMYVCSIWSTLLMDVSTR